MQKFPVDAPKARVLRALGSNHATIKGSTLRTICRQADIGREDFLTAFDNA